uniref:hypothetical protein n=1 Tax=Agrobacterium fabrum TaxID=1176649 RepID=UPI00155DD70F|nr:hypothetical protein [Agrobacterium fabrum]
MPVQLSPATLVKLRRKPAVTSGACDGWQVRQGGRKGGLAWPGLAQVLHGFLSTSVSEVCLWPFRPSVSWRSEPAPVRFKAAVAPRGGRSCRSRQSRHAGFARAWAAPLDRMPSSLDLACPDPEPPGLRRFLVAAPKDGTVRGPTLR